MSLWLGLASLGLANLLARERVRSSEDSLAGDGGEGGVRLMQWQWPVDVGGVDGAEGRGAMRREARRGGAGVEEEERGSCAKNSREVRAIGH